jgi:hypothetical protein
MVEHSNEGLATRALEGGKRYPYHRRDPIDWAERAALGILNDLLDRRGIKNELGLVDDDVPDGQPMTIRIEIVQRMAEIIRQARTPHDPA